VRWFATRQPQQRERVGDIKQCLRDVAILTRSSLVDLGETPRSARSLVFLTFPPVLQYEDLVSRWARLEDATLINWVANRSAAIRRAMEDWLKTAEVMQLCGWTIEEVLPGSQERKWRVQKPHAFHPGYRYTGTIFKRTFSIASEQLC